ncbi:hypothetical protein EJ576_24340 [Pseudomonas sp. C 49-2]|nr:hypothetical protein EJ576_24340 [Pseudomonas sp. C 49-2]
MSNCTTSTALAPAYSTGKVSLRRCAAATATAAGTIQGMSSDQHLINSAKTLADRALDCLHSA